MPEPTIVELRTLELPLGLFVVLWDQVVEGRKLLAILPEEEAQTYLDALQAGQTLDLQPQVVEERGATLSPVPQAEAEHYLQCYLKAWTQGGE